MTITPPALSLGVDVPTGFYEQRPIESFEGIAGRPVNVVQNFISWGYSGGQNWNLFPTRHVKEILARGSTPEITWDPAVNGDGSNQPQMSLASIAAGSYDQYVVSFAEAARDAGGVVFIRFAHEMNGPWNSYAESNSGNRPGDFVRAWRHVHDLFLAADATNVKWIWSPNVEAVGAQPLSSLYPGDEYVDYVGVDGYSYPLAGCKTAKELFGPTLADIASFTARPVMLSEVAVSSACPNKAALIGGLFQWLGENPDVRGFTWWNRDEGPNDWRADSSPQAAEAFAQGLQDDRRPTISAGEPEAEAEAPATTAETSGASTSAEGGSNAGAQAPLTRDGPGALVPPLPGGTGTTSATGSVIAPRGSGHPADRRVPSKARRARSHSPSAGRAHKGKRHRESLRRNGRGLPKAV